MKATKLVPLLILGMLSSCGLMPNDLETVENWGRGDEPADDKQRAYIYSMYSSDITHKYMASHYFNRLSHKDEYDINAPSAGSDAINIAGIVFGGDGTSSLLGAADLMKGFADAPRNNMIHSINAMYAGAAALYGFLPGDEETDLNKVVFDAFFEMESKVLKDVIAKGKKCQIQGYSEELQYTRASRFTHQQPGAYKMRSHDCGNIYVRIWSLASPLPGISVEMIARIEPKEWNYIGAQREIAELYEQWTAEEESAVSRAQLLACLNCGLTSNMLYVHSSGKEDIYRMPTFK